MSYELQDISKQEQLDQPYKNLKVYQKAYAISLEIYRTSASFPKEEKFGIIDQLRRSATSICANIAEGYGRQLSSDADFKRFLVMAKASCQEIGVWIDYCRDLSFVNDSCHEKWQQEYTEISKMLFALIKTLESRNSKLVTRNY
jgi:four helix bundle protein